MFSRMHRWTAALAFAAVLVAGPASAVSILPGGSYSLLPSTLYIASQTHDGAASGSDIYTFTFSSPASIGAPVLDTTTNVNVGGTGFTTLTLDWIGPALSSLIGGPQSVPTTNLIDQILPLVGYGTYKLVIAWSVGKDSTGGYQSFLKTPTGDSQNPVPLPPALLLFGSALVGLGVLGRRRRQGAAG
jgi:hypothetical protein